MADEVFEARLLPRRKDGDVEVFRMKVLNSSGEPIDLGSGGGGSGGGGSLRAIMWDGSEYAYNHPEWWDDTSIPRQFVGPVDPNTIGVITLGYLDSWIPSGSTP